MRFSENSFCSCQSMPTDGGLVGTEVEEGGTHILRAERGKKSDRQSSLKKSLVLCCCHPWQPVNQAEAAHGSVQPSIVTCGCSLQSPGTADPGPSHCNSNNHTMTAPTY